MYMQGGRLRTLCPAGLSTLRRNFLSQLGHSVTLGKSCHLWSSLDLHFHVC